MEEAANPAKGTVTSWRPQVNVLELWLGALRKPILRSNHHQLSSSMAVAAAVAQGRRTHTSFIFRLDQFAILFVPQEEAWLRAQQEQQRPYGGALFESTNE